MSRKQKTKKVLTRIVFESPYTKPPSSSISAVDEAALLAQTHAAFAPFRRRPGTKTLAKQKNSSEIAPIQPTADWAVLASNVALGINAVSKALESDSARAIVVCGGASGRAGAPDRPAVLVAHLFAGAAARQVPAIDLVALDGLQLASSLRMRSLGAFAILRSADSAPFVALADAVARHAPRLEQLPWIPLYLSDAERQDAQPIGRHATATVSTEAASSAQPLTAVAPSKRALLPAQTRRVRPRRTTANVSDATTTTAATTTTPEKSNVAAT